MPGRGTPARPPDVRGAAGVLLALLLSAALTAQAQQVLFVSDRHDPRGVLQNDVYRWEGGSEDRVTETPGWAEFDPEPTPDGDRFVVAATNFIDGVTRFDDDWSWRYAVHREDGRLLDRWDIAGSEGTFRPAGGFQIAWLPDGDSFLGNAYDPGLRDWRVVRYVVGAERTIDLGYGFDIVLHPDGERFATSRHGVVEVVEIATGERRGVFTGRPLGWTKDGTELIFDQNGVLYRARPDGDPRDRRVLAEDGTWIGLRYAPRAGYAVAGIGQDTSTLVFFDEEHVRERKLTVVTPIVDFDWLDETWLVVEYVTSRERWLELVAVDGRIAPFVDSHGEDGSPRTVLERSLR